MTHTFLRTCALVAMLAPAGALPAEEQATQPAAPQPSTASPTESPPDAPRQPTTGARDPAAELQAVRSQLLAMLQEAGLPSHEQREQVAANLDRIAQRSAELAGELADHRGKLAARNVEIQAYNAMAQQAEAQRKPLEASYRVGQMRGAAVGTKELKAPGANLVGDFWLMQADLFDINRAGRSPDSRQRQAIERIERFLRDHSPPAGDLERSIITDVKLSLLRLYDQRGMSHQACALTQSLRSQGEALNDPTLLAQLARWFAYCDLIGRQFDASLRTADGKPWSGRSRRGQYVLLHFWAEWFAPSVESIGQLRQALADHKGPPVSVLSVRVDSLGSLDQQARHPAAVPPTLDWPLYEEGPEQVSLRRMFEVRSLPRFVLIDPEGRVAAIGGGPAILDQAVIPPAAQPSPSTPIASPPAAP